MRGRQVSWFRRGLPPRGGSIEQIRVEKSFYSECAIGGVLRMIRRLPSS